MKVARSTYAAVPALQVPLNGFDHQLTLVRVSMPMYVDATHHIRTLNRSLVESMWASDSELSTACHLSIGSSEQCVWNAALGEPGGSVVGGRRGIWVPGAAAAGAAAGGSV